MVPPARISWCALAALLAMWPWGRAQETYYRALPQASRPTTSTEAPGFGEGFETYYFDGFGASETFETSRRAGG